MKQIAGDLEKTNFELERKIKVKERDIVCFKTEIQERDSEIATLQQQVIFAD